MLVNRFREGMKRDTERGSYRRMKQTRKDISQLFAHTHAHTESNVNNPFYFCSVFSILVDEWEIPRRFLFLYQSVYLPFVLLSPYHNTIPTISESLYQGHMPRLHTLTSTFMCFLRDISLSGYWKLRLCHQNKAYYFNSGRFVWQRYTWRVCITYERLVQVNNGYDRCRVHWSESSIV